MEFRRIKDFFARKLICEVRVTQWYEKNKHSRVKNYYNLWYRNSGRDTKISFSLSTFCFIISLFYINFERFYRISTARSFYCIIYFQFNFYVLCDKFNFINMHIRIYSFLRCTTFYFYITTFAFLLWNSHRISNA